MKKVLIAFGTRPEVIKLAPVIHALDRDFALSILHTGQHKELVAPLLSLFAIKPDISLDIMQPGQNLFDLTEQLLPKLKKSIDSVKPDYVVVQGDTSTSFLTALAAFYHQIPVLHVEAGLRSHDINSPFPEEMNRRQISVLAHHHFAPTELNQQNLLQEGVAPKNISITGNTVIDALHHIQNTEKYKSVKPAILSNINSEDKLIVLTAHRRENHGEPLLNIFKAVNQLLDEFEDLKVIFPAHPNPKVKEALDKAQIKNERLIVTSPIDYLPFLHVLDQADLILTDSGGIQEEASALGKFVLVLRNETERQELIDAGLGTLVGTDSSLIIKEARKKLPERLQTITAASVFGDGQAAEKIRKVLLNQL